MSLVLVSYDEVGLSMPVRPIVHGAITHLNNSQKIHILMYRKVASSRPVYYSILGAFGQRS